MRFRMQFEVFAEIGDFLSDPVNLIAFLLAD